MTINLKKIGLTVLSASALFLAACGTEDAAETNENAVVDGEEFELVYVEWENEIASANVIGQVLEEVGYDVTLTSVDNAVMWSSVATGDADAMVAAMLPITHGSQYEQYGDTMDHVGTNLEGGRIGLAVPEYMDVDSIDELTDEVDQTITGIEAGSGNVELTEQAIEDYDNLSDWTVSTSSSGAMITELETALENEEDIIITAWNPHWKFQVHDLKYLDDPEGTFGDEETVESFAREGLKEDKPEAYSVLSNYQWTLEDVEGMMLEISEGTSPEDAAAEWIENNRETVDEWIADIQ